MKLSVVGRIWRFVSKGFGTLVALLLVRMLMLLVKHYRLRRLFLKKNPHLDNRGISTRGPIGSLPEVLKNFGRLYDWKVDQYLEYGTKNKKFAVCAPFWEPKIFISSADPKVTKHILKDNFNNYLKGEKMRRHFKILLGDGIFVVNHSEHAEDKGKAWFYQRKTASKIFTRNVFTGIMFDTFHANSEKIVKRLREVDGKRNIDMSKIFAKFTLDSISTIGFGHCLNTLNQEENHPFADSFDQAQRLISKRLQMPFIETLGRVYKLERDLLYHCQVLDDFAYKVIEDRLVDPHIKEKNDILSHFINDLRDNEGVEINHDKKCYLRDIVLSMFIAGRDTTACTLTFCLYYLCLNPEVQEALYEEVKFTGDAEEVPSLTWQELKDGYPYLNAVIKETLRLAPPVPVDGKEAVDDDVLPDGTFVPAGTRISFEPYILGRNKEYWGEDAEEFRPERWLGPNGKDPSEWEFPVFQPGYRVCLGKDLAQFEAKVLIAQLIRRFQFKLDRPVVDPPYLVGLTMGMRDDLPVIATPRPNAM